MRKSSAFLPGLLAASVGMAAISGRVTDIAGSGIPAAVVMLQKQSLTATTGADGSFTLATSAAAPDGRSRPRPQDLFASIRNGFLCVTAEQGAPLEISAFLFNGRVISERRHETTRGRLSVALPRCGAGVCLYKVRSGSREALLKSTSMGASGGRTATVAGSSPELSMPKRALTAAAINDILTVTQNEYLNYRMTITNFDTSGIEIKMIACAGIMTDTDGNSYQTVKIGNQIWTVENLRTTSYNDGSAIPLVTDSASWTMRTTPGYCFYTNMTNAVNIKKFGALYNWYSIDTRKLAPTGWHVPKDSEWGTLSAYLITNGYNYDGTTTDNKVAKSLAAKTDWAATEYPGTIGYTTASNNTSGFCAFPAGMRYDNGGFDNITFCGCWWSAEEFDSTTALNRTLCSSIESLNTSSYSKSCGFSVRLVKD